jgi:hypothetical protein
MRASSEQLRRVFVQSGVSNSVAPAADQAMAEVAVLEHCRYQRSRVVTLVSTEKCGW